MRRQTVESDWVRRLVAITLFFAFSGCFQQIRAKASRPPIIHREYPGRRFEATPIAVDNAMYFPTPDSKVIAVNAMTGRSLWEYGPHVKYSRNWASTIDVGPLQAMVTRFD